MQGNSDGDLHTYLEELRKQSIETLEQGVSILVMGAFGAGKTHLLKTAPKPVLVDMFDPRGAAVLRDEIRSGSIIVRPWWDERSDRPTKYNEWAQRWEKDIESGLLDQFQTYALDSLTTFLEAMANAVSRQFGRPHGTLAIQDYNVIYNRVRDFVKITSTKARVFVVTGHLVSVKNDLTGEVTYELDTYNRLRNRLPILFSEKWVLVARKKPNGVERVVLTQPTGMYYASSQLTTESEIQPDISAALRKAGFNFNHKQEGGSQ